MLTQHGTFASGVDHSFLFGRFLGIFYLLTYQSFSQIIPLRLHLEKILSAKRTAPNLRRETSLAKKMVLLTRENMKAVLDLFGQGQADDTFKILGQ